MSGMLVLAADMSAVVGEVVRRVEEAQGNGQIRPVCVLLPSKDVEADVQEALAKKLGGAMGVYLYQFYSLGKAMVSDAGEAVQDLNDIAIRRLMRRILGEMAGEGVLTTFSAVWEKPGFVEILLEWVREMKSQGIRPEDVAAYAQVSGSEKERQLGEFYARYQVFLQQGGFSDADGLLWLAAEALERDAALFRKRGPVLVAGFDQFTPVQVRILRQLVERCEDVRLFLLWDKNRPEDSMALSRLRATRLALEEQIPLEVTYLPGVDAGEGTLVHLKRRLFEGDGAEIPQGEAILWVEAPSRETEVRSALRAVKKLLLTGKNPESIAILAPNPQVYEAVVRAVAFEYSVPVWVETPLLENPAVVALVNVLGLAPDFPWQSTLTALRSPYVRQAWLTVEQIGLIDRLSRERPVVSGRAQWEFALKPLGPLPDDGEDEDLGPPPLVSSLERCVLEELWQGLGAFFDHLSPPKEASYWEYTRWLQSAIVGVPQGGGDEMGESTDEPVVPEAGGTSLDLLGTCREGDYAPRDEGALSQVMQILRRVLDAAEIISGEETVRWEIYRDEVVSQLGTARIPPDGEQAMVRFGPMEAGRARVVDHLFVLGLSEGEFPTPPEVDPLYALSERENHPLPLQRYSAASDACLWWQVCGNARVGLVLLRPYIDENGAPWQASPYWEAAQAPFQVLQVARMPIAEHPEAQEAASLSELLVALVQVGARDIPPELAGKRQYAQQAEQVRQQRESYAPPGIYEGILNEAGIRAEMAGRFGERHTWSASRLNRYANCPFGFFCEYVLKLEARPEPEEGLDVRQRGSLLHAMLEELYRHLARVGMAPNPENQGAILETLEAQCKALFENAPQRYGFRPGALWTYEQAELLRLVQSLVVWDCEQNQGAAAYMPYLQEAGFGIGRAGPRALEIEAGEIRFRLRGLIDRLDRDGNGNLRVIDYKSGSQGYYRSDLEKGLATQTALYALAAERYWLGEAGRVASSEYWHIPSRQASGKLSFQGEVEADEMAAKVLQQAAWSVMQARAGVFPSAPAKPGQGGRGCTNWCDYAALCRVSRQSIAKARQGGNA